MLPTTEFAFNKSTNRTIGKSPFEVVYGKNPLRPLDLSPLLVTHSFSGDVADRVKQLKKLHEKVRAHIEKQNAKYKEKADTHRKHVVLKEGDLVWVHLSKESFQTASFRNYKSELMDLLRCIK